jgi:hypothetical protein
VPYPKLEDLEEEHKANEEEIDKMNEHMEVGTELELFKGTAFIVFDKKSDQEKAIDYFAESLMARFLRYTIGKICKIIDKERTSDNPYFFDGKRITLDDAPEPTDVFWENMHIKFKDRIRRVFITWFVTFFLLGLCFLFLTSLA